MAGPWDSDHPRVAIIGGGLTGLTAAYSLQKHSAESGVALPFVLLEGSARWGGNLITEEIDGFLVEGGADSFILRKPWAMELAAELGLDKEIIHTPREHGRGFVRRKGQLVPLPVGMRFVVPTQLGPLLGSSLLSWRGKIRMLLERWIRRRQDESEESLGAFVRRRFGREALEVIGDPLMAGIHAADPERLSLQAAFPEMAALERSFGSLIRGMKEVHGSPRDGSHTENSSRVTLRGGIRQLVEALSARIEPSALRLESPVAVLRRREGGFEIRLASGERLTPEAVILAVPADAAAKLVAEIDGGLSETLASISYVSSATVALGFRQQDVGRSLDALGFVVPKSEPCRLQACTWSSAKFAGRAPEGHVLLRGFVGGAGSESLVELDDEELTALVLAELDSLMELSGPPVLTRIYRWRRGIPQYHLGHLQKVSRIEAHGVEGLFLAGNAYRGVGLPDCVRSGRQASEEVSELLKQ